MADVAATDVVNGDGILIKELCGNIASRRISKRERRPSQALISSVQTGSYESKNPKTPPQKRVRTSHHSPKKKEVAAREKKIVYIDTSIVG